MKLFPLVLVLAASFAFAQTPPVMHSGRHVDDTTIPPPKTGFTIPWVQLLQFTAQPDAVGAFRTICDTAFYSYDDPIVYPGQPGKSHLHVVFGGDDKAGFANLTAANVRTTGGSTCRGGTINLTRYWVPALIDSRTQEVIPYLGALVYYKTSSRGPISPAATVDVPQGLRMIAGDPTATTPATGWNLHYDFSCAGNGVHNDHIVVCPAGVSLWLTINFPNCWDGVNLDSPDHKSHVIYSTPGVTTCPATHPKALPTITYQVVVKPPADPNQMLYAKLVSDGYDDKTPGGYSMHGDYFMGWDPAIVHTWTENCLKKSVDCKSGPLGDGRSMWYCGGNVGGTIGCIPNPVPSTTPPVAGSTRLSSENQWFTLDISRTVMFGPNADGSSVSKTVAGGSYYCSAANFGNPPKGTAARGCSIPTPNPFSP